MIKGIYSQIRKRVGLFKKRPELFHVGSMCMYYWVYLVITLIQRFIKYGLYSSSYPNVAYLIVPIAVTVLVLIATALFRWSSKRRKVAKPDLTKFRTSIDLFIAII
jgi:hypothetical protein